MTHTITKTFRFSASHQLDGLGDRHKCARLHGHNYEVDIELTGPLDRNGMVLDYGDLAPFKQYIDEVYDHQHLNDVVPFNPTAEMLAEHFHTEARRFILTNLPTDVTISAVRVRETPRTAAEYRP